MVSSKAESSQIWDAMLVVCLGDRKKVVGKDRFENSNLCQDMEDGIIPLSLLLALLPRDGYVVLRCSYAAVVEYSL